MLTIFLGIFLRRAWLNWIAVVAGAVVLWLPLLSLLSALGEPSPFAPSGNYRLLSSKYIEDKEQLYLFVDTLGRDYTPRVYRIHFDKTKYKRMQETASDYAMQVVHISNDSFGDSEVVYVMYDPPDLLKGDMMRGYTPERTED